MSFDYDTIRARKHESGTQWAAYSDLFMVLAFVFLLMYMVSSLRTGMISVTTHAQIEEVKQELQLYESVKNQYLEEKEKVDMIEYLDSYFKDSRESWFIDRKIAPTCR